jgi:hypothetical protein
MSDSNDSLKHDTEAHSTWSLAVHAAALLAINPVGLAGARIHAGAGPVRDAWMSLLQTLMGDSAWKRMPVNITDERLLGGLDLSATLSAGRPILQQGVLADVNGGTWTNTEVFNVGDRRLVKQATKAHGLNPLSN